MASVPFVPRQVAPASSGAVGEPHTPEAALQFAIKHGRLCPWCTGILEMVNTSLGPMFVCTDEFKRACNYTCAARYASGHKMKWMPEDAARVR